MTKFNRSLALLLALTSREANVVTSFVAAPSKIRPQVVAVVQPSSSTSSLGLFPTRQHAKKINSIHPAATEREASEKKQVGCNNNNGHNNIQKKLLKALVMTALSTAATFLRCLPAHANKMTLLDKMPSSPSSVTDPNRQPAIAFFVLTFFIVTAFLRAAGEGVEYLKELWIGIRDLGKEEDIHDDSVADIDVGSDNMASKMVHFNYYYNADDDDDRSGAFSSQHLLEKENEDQDEEKEALDMIHHAKSLNWNSYQNVVLSKNTKRGNKDGWMKGLGAWFVKLFRIDHDNNNMQTKRESPEAKQKANEIFQQKQYEQHHHVIRVPILKENSNATDKRSSSSSNSDTNDYLNSLHRFSTNIDNIENNAPTDIISNEGVTKHYLDSLSREMYAKRSWGEYQKNYLKNIAAASDSSSRDDEVNELKQEVSNLQDLMQMEQSMYQTSNQALKLAMDAQKQELDHIRNKSNYGDDEDCDGDGVNDTISSSIEDQLKEFDEKAQQFKESVELPSVEDSKEANWFV